MQFYLGLDVHSKMTVFCAQTENGRIHAEGQFPTSPAGLEQLLAAVAPPPTTAVALETGTQAAWMTELLARHGMAPRIIDAHEVRAKARRPHQKSDRRDAFELCDGLRRGIWTSDVYLPSPTIEQMRLLLSRRRHFVRLASKQINAVRFLLRRKALGRLARSLRTEVAWQRLLAQPELAPWQRLIQMHYELWALACRQAHQLQTQLLSDAVVFEPTMALLQTMPGIGPIVAATFIAALGDPHRFDDSSRVVSYAGLAVATYHSGERERFGHITKRGNPELRAMLCEAAHHAARPTHPLHPYYARMAARRGLKPAVVAVAQRLARILWRMWRDGQRFDLNRLNVIAVRKVKSRPIHFEIKQRPATAAHA